LLIINIELFSDLMLDDQTCFLRKFSKFSCFMCTNLILLVSLVY